MGEPPYIRTLLAGGHRWLPMVNIKVGGDKKRTRRSTCQEDGTKCDEEVWK